eukprot:CAMPEP_0174368356 /NCGR_PEP_ID=MMETSP0811_2-20130205/88771_1 /TAXON_ID=73025 ORGANISM="Eutreptiella gymnastica-like, Strain CCMP1594" /NCGR_SAMPLE_ID=MMETSP0811_2 /ASSEMBLY_ACC=CAM_ASM_000667 /LENGTH=152 /DNA_ID=CAMNT_0015511797 /DNA_START=16 /DNA_END=474 /DNA_ORIENTATION=+
MVGIATIQLRQRQVSVKKEGPLEIVELPIPKDVKMILVVRKDLKMGPGKQCAQCCHAGVGMYRLVATAGQRVLWQHWLKYWEMEGSNKVLLQASSEEELVEARKTARKLDLPCVLVADAGRTQIAAGSKTVLALGPAPTEMMDEIATHFSPL